MVLERGAGRQVHDEGGLAETVALYLEQPELRRATGEAAQKLVAENRGAVERTLQLMSDSLRWTRPELDTSNSVFVLRD